MRLLDYECQTTFWEDFTVTEMFGEEVIRGGPYKRAKAEWSADCIYGAELPMILNHKCRYWYEERNETLSKLYAEL